MISNTRFRFRGISLCVLCAVLLTGVLRAPSAHADAADDQFAVANGLYKEKVWTTAAENLRDFLKAHPNHPKAKPAAYLLGAALYRITNTQGEVDYAAAAAAYERALTQYPDPTMAADARYELGDIYFNLKKYDKAASTYTQFLQSTPPADKAAEAYYGIAESYYALNKHTEARTAYEKIATQYGTSRPAPYAQLALGVLAEDAKQLGAAAAAYKVVLDRHPKSEVVVEARLRMAHALLALKRYDEASTAYKASLADPAAAEWKVDALLGLGDVQFASKKWKDASDTFTQILTTLKPDDSRRAALQLRLADSYYNAKEYERAIAAYAPLTGSTDQKIAANALYFGAVSQQALKQHTKAAQDYRKLLDTYPQSDKAPRAALRMGDAYAEAKEAGRAAEAYKLVLTKYAQSDAAKEARVALLELAGEVAGGTGAQAESVEAVLRTLPAGAAASNAQLRLAQAAFQREDWAKASQLAGAALAAKPDAATAENALYVMASAQLRAGKAADAATTFRRQLTSHAKGKYASEAHLGLTWALMDAQKWPEAETAARAAVTALTPAAGKTPNTSLYNQARLALGESLLRNKKAKDAAPVFAALAGATDKDLATQATYGAALAFQAQSQWGSAATNWGKYAGLSADPATKARAYFQQGQALVKAKNGTAALAAFDKAVAADPKGDVGAQALYESAWTAHDLKQSTQETARWQRLVAEFPESKFAAEASLLQGEALFATKSWTEAAAAYRRVTERHPQSDAAPQAWYKLGSALYNLKSWSEAAAAFDKAATFSKSPAAVESNYWAGESLARANDLGAAGSRFEAFIRNVAADSKAPANVKALIPAARLRLGQSLASAKNWPGATAAYQAGLTDASGVIAAELTYSLGEALLQQNKYKEAAAQFVKVFTLYSKSEWAPRAQWYAAEATEKSGDKAAAIALYRVVATSQPASEFAAQAQEKLKALGAD